MQPPRLARGQAGHQRCLPLPSSSPGHSPPQPSGPCNLCPFRKPESTHRATPNPAWTWWLQGSIRDWPALGEIELALQIQWLTRQVRRQKPKGKKRKTKRVTFPLLLFLSRRVSKTMSETVREVYPERHSLALAPGASVPPVRAGSPPGRDGLTHTCLICQANHAQCQGVQVSRRAQG